MIHTSPKTLIKGNIYKVLLHDTKNSEYLEEADWRYANTNYMLFSKKDIFQLLDIVKEPSSRKTQMIYKLKILLLQTYSPYFKKDISPGLKDAGKIYNLRIETQEYYETVVHFEDVED